MTTVLPERRKRVSREVVKNAILSGQYTMTMADGATVTDFRKIEQVFGKYRTVRRTSKVLHPPVRRTDNKPQIKGTLATLIQLHGCRCHWCQRECDASLPSSAELSPTRDHVVRLSDGGSNTLDNLVLSCRKCNTTRHNPKWSLLNVRNGVWP